MRFSARTADALVFVLSLLAVAWFHQGGGWNQNARFAMVRAIVEEGSLSIDSHLVYYREDDGDADDRYLQRLPVERGTYQREGSRFALAWTRPDGSLVPVDAEAASGRRPVPLDAVAASGDVSFAAGRFHPNKAPGTSLLAVPGYALVHAIATALGRHRDDWAVVTTAAWLTTVLSVGLVTAFGSVLVLRLSRSIASEWAARAAAVTFVLGTMAWPLGTMLMEHNPIAVTLLAALWCVERACAGTGRERTAALLHAAGFLCGLAAITNYTMALLVPLLALYLLARTKEFRGLLPFAAGLLWPLAAICAYNIACFGTPFTTNYAWQSPMFTSGERTLGVFALPRADVAALLLFSPLRGLFFTSPVLLCAVAALVPLSRDRRPLAALVATVAGFLLLVNASFNGWDGGWTAVPRYLGPGVGLLALPLAVAFDRWRRITAALAAVSIGMQLLLTAVDPQTPVGGDAGTAGLRPAEVFFTNPITEYVLPLFVEGRPMPLLEQTIERAAEAERGLAMTAGDAPELVESRVARRRSALQTAVDRWSPKPLPLAGVEGPVSANPIGIAEGGYFRLTRPLQRHARGNSFNVGEWLLPQSRASLLPLVLALAVLAACLLAPDPRSSLRAGRGSTSRPGSPSPD